MRAPAKPSRAPLDRDRIVRTATEVADAEGIDAVTVRRLATELGVHFSSLYTHVASKEAILDGITEQLLAEAAIAVEFEDWRDWVRAFAQAMRRVARAHPGAALVFTRRPATGPLATRQTEGALAAFRRAGFSPLDAGDAVNGVSLAVLGLALNECVTGPVTPPDLTHLAPSEFPHIFEVAAVTGESTSTWELIVESLIAGLASRAATT